MSKTFHHTFYAVETAYVNILTHIYHPNEFEAMFVLYTCLHVRDLTVPAEPPVRHRWNMSIAVSRRIRKLFQTVSRTYPTMLVFYFPHRIQYHSDEIC